MEIRSAQYMWHILGPLTCMHILGPNICNIRTIYATFQIPNTCKNKYPTYGDSCAVAI